MIGSFINAANTGKRERASDRILASYNSKVQEQKVNPCTLVGYAALGERSARLIFASSAPIQLEDARNFVFEATDHKLIPIAASFAASNGCDEMGRHYATLIASRAAVLMEPFDSQDNTKVCMNASATVFLDQNLGCTWERKSVDGKDYLVRSNAEDIDAVLKTAMTASADMRVDADDFKMPITAGSYVRFLGMEGEFGVPFIEVGEVMEVNAAAGTMKLAIEDNGTRIETEVPIHAALSLVPVEAASSRQEVLEFLYRAYGPKWKEIVNQTGAFK